MEYGKLVRDGIPAIIEAEGKRAVVRTLTKEEYLRALHAKLDEEVAEVHESGELEELADILEVVLALCEAQGDTREALERAYRQKHDARGGFEKRVFLVRTQE